MEIAWRKAERIICRVHKNCQDRREKENIQGKSEYDEERKQVKKGRNA
jgi:hypothetical protein